MNLETCVGKIFSDIKTNPSGKSYRKNQHDYAIKMAKWLSLSDHDDSKPTINLAHVPCGVGKTFAYLVAAGLAVKMGYQHKIIISTFTKALREDILEEFEHVKPIIDKYHPSTDINIGSVRSIYSSFSLEEVRKVKDVYPDLYKYVVECYENDQMPDADGYLELDNSDNIPDSKLKDFYLTYDEVGNMKSSNSMYSAIKKIEEDNEKVKQNNNIIVVTHAMFVMNGINFGAKLGTIRGKEKVAAIIDEADMLSSVGNNVLKRRISFSLLEYISRKAKGHLLSDIIQDIKNIGCRYIDYYPTQIKYHKLLTDLYKEVSDVKGVDKPTINYVLDTLHYMMCVISNVDGRSTAFAAIVSEANIINIINEDSISLESVGKGKNAASKTWRAHSFLNFGNITLLSGTLLDRNDEFTHLMKTMSISTNNTYTIGYGDNKQKCSIVLCETDTPEPHGDTKVIKDGEYDDWTNQKHIDFMAKCFENNDPDKATLFLFASYASLYRFYDAIKDAYHYRVICQKRGESPISIKKRLEGKNSPILLSTKWSGVNWVNSSGTIFKRVVIAKIPVIGDDKEYPYQKATQGIWRTIRNPNDEPEIWVMDNVIEKDSAIFRDLSMDDISYFNKNGEKNEEEWSL